MPDTKQGTEKSLESCIFSDAMMCAVLALAEGAASIDEIAHISGLAQEQIQPCLAVLDQKWLVESRTGACQLSQSGTILVLKVARFIHVIESFDNALNATGIHNPDSIIQKNASPLQYFLEHRAGIAALITHCASLEGQSAGRDPGYRSGIGTDERTGTDTGSCGAEGVCGTFPSGIPASYPKDSLHVIYNSYSEVVKTIQTLEKFVDFFETHSLEGIPEVATSKIGVLISAELICDFPLDFTEGLDFFLQILRNANHIHGVSGFAKQNIADVLSEKVLEGIEVDLVVTPDVIRELFLPPYREKAMRLQHYPNLVFRVSTVPIHVGLTVTDKCLSFGLYTKGGHTYDSIYDLVCGSPEAIEWGEMLFQYHKERSVTLDEYLRDPINLLKILNPFHLKKKKL